MKPIYYRIPFFNLLLAALLGLLLRGAFVFPIEGMTFLYVLHGHSHVALLGWLYLLVYVLLVDQFAVKTPEEERFYRRLYWVTQGAVIGMALTFPFQGYAAPSIFFSTLHIICSYLFVYRLGRNYLERDRQQTLWMKTALFFMVFSTIGVWFLGPAIGMMGKASPFFQLCIQFFLHFQFDGWFFTAFIALLYAYAFPEPLKQNSLNSWYGLWIVSVVLTYALPVGWFSEASLWYYLNAGGVLLQAIALYMLMKPLLLRHIKEQSITSIWKNILFLLAISCIAIRLFLQLLTLAEPLVLALKGVRGWVVGFIHLNMLGIFTALGVWILIQTGKISLTFWTKIGCVCLCLGFILTEGLLGIQGAQQFLRVSWLDAYSILQLLFWFSVFLPVSVVCFLMNRKWN
ncbi:hypothetical protein [Myroides fluvii]|uniref:hypothetical protein n=1 Tax=Myroides fluvii TaxID=2572594 RepID=UPI00131E739F|nr:hypothetical protein [Myroides fluvii]